MRILVLDDSPSRHKAFKRNLIGHEQVVHALTYDEALGALAAAALHSTPFDIMYLDHDLNLEGEHVSIRVDDEGKRWELTGAHFAQDVAELAEEARPKLVIVHSYNPAGAKNITEILVEAGIRTYRELFSAYSGENVTHLARNE